MHIPESLRKEMRQNEHNQRRISELAKKYYKTGKVLDLGSGNGKLIEEIAQNARIPKKNITCTEIKEENLVQCKMRGFVSRRCDLNKGFGLPSSSFDLVVANQVIEHIIFTDIFISEIHRVLKKDGILIISSTNLAALHNRVLLAMGFMPNCLHPSRKIVGTLFGKRGENPMHGHKSVFTAGALREFLELNGFKVIFYETQSILFLPKALSEIICKIFHFGTHVNIVAKKI